MGPENSKKLTERFEFMRTSGDPMEDLLVFGFECGDGWFQIIWDLCTDLEKINEEYLKTIPDYIKAKKLLELGYDTYALQVMQVKEKFGTLRFYTNGAPKEAFDRIREAEKLSSETCEECGEKGELKSRNGWYSVRCSKCE